MVNLLYAQVIQTLIEQTREQKLVWEIHELSRYPELEPESLVSKPYFTRFKGRNMLLSQERMPPYKLDSDVIIRLRFLDDAGKFVEDFPNVSNLSKL
ncbi:MAG: hypothetical protein RML40_12130, partial [Bacteroidota bacterium]|nr:hypothetical protein [Candidatus Kapabacteria bacterium]MDW8221263.1 hypothetical protein [Bacteroidota bacterium]